MTDKEEPSIEEQARLAEMIAIAEQNDLFRQKPTLNEASGRWVYTAAINAEGPAFLEDCVKAVGDYSDFTEDNDPYPRRLSKRQNEDKTSERLVSIFQK